ncbi:MAG: hypothetical protein QXU98_13425, partial [Candidatus Parvarchaeota archaeon]
EGRQDFGIRDETKIKKFLMDPSQTSQEFQLRYPAGGSLLIITFDKDLNINRAAEWLKDLKEWFANKAINFLIKRILTFLLY